MDADELMMTALDAGAEDFNEEEDSYEVLTAPDDLGAVRLFGFAGSFMRPQVFRFSAVRKALRHN